MRRMKATLTVLFVLAGLVTLLVVKPPLSLRLREVIVSAGTRYVSENDLIRLAGIQQGENLLELSLAEVRERIRRYPWVRDVHLARSFPGRLEIEVKEEEPVALLELETLYLVNGEGKVFKRVGSGDPRNLPLLTGLDPKGFEEGGPGFGQMESLLNLLLDAQSLPVFERVGISEIHSDNRGLTLFTLSPVMRLYLGSGHWADRLERFNAAYETILGTTRDPYFIDLSYDRRIFVKRRT